MSVKMLALESQVATSFPFGNSFSPPRNVGKHFHLYENKGWKFPFFMYFYVNFLFFSENGWHLKHRRIPHLIKGMISAHASTYLSIVTQRLASNSKEFIISISFSFHCSSGWTCGCFKWYMFDREHTNVYQRCYFPTSRQRSSWPSTRHHQANRKYQTWQDTIKNYASLGKL